jgi:hypothetical protein
MVSILEYFAPNRCTIEYFAPTRAYVIVVGDSLLLTAEGVMKTFPTREAAEVAIHRLFPLQSFYRVCLPDVERRY